MARKRFRRALLAVIPTALVLAVAPAGAALNNGNFETGTLSGWSTFEEGSGSWMTYTGSTAPLSGESVQSPPQGTFAVVTDTHGGPGTRILYQDISLPAESQLKVAFTLYYDNQNGSFETPNSLSHEPTTTPNQQFRVDVIKPGANIKTLSSSDILVPVFRTATSDPATMLPRRIMVDLAPFAGQTVRLRFAEVDNQFFFFASVDDVALFEQAPSSTVANPVVATLLPDAQVHLQFSAKLTSEGAAVEGEQIDFKVGSTIVCSATTGADGVASCGEPAQEINAILAGGYQAVFAGSEALLSSQDRGPILNFMGSDI